MYCSFTALTGPSAGDRRKKTGHRLTGKSPLSMAPQPSHPVGQRSTCLRASLASHPGFRFVCSFVCWLFYLPHFAVENVLPCVNCTHVLTQTFRKRTSISIFKFNFVLFIFQNNQLPGIIFHMDIVIDF